MWDGLSVSDPLWETPRLWPEASSRELEVRSRHIADPVRAALMKSPCRRDRCRRSLPVG
jgi:hypothetical protein